MSVRMNGGYEWYEIVNHHSGIRDRRTVVV